MPLTIDLELRGETASGTLQALANQLADRKPLHAALGKRGEFELRGHFEKRESEPNSKGWPKQHFWSRIRTATAFASADAQGATVAISDPAIAQKIYGGTITPKEGKYLALPAIAEAYGHGPLNHHGLHPLIRRINGEVRATALVENDATPIKIGRKRKDGTRKITPGAEVGGRVWYWLVKSVTQDPDARALPADADFRAALLDEAGDYFGRLA